jgi:hypothetical protein
MPRRNVLVSPRLSELKKRRRRSVVNKFLISLLGLVAIFALFSYISRLDSLNIKDIQIAGNKALDAETVKNAVSQKLTGKYIWLFPKTNILYYPQGGIKSELQNQFKRIENIDLSVDTNKILIITLAEREAKYTWCGQEISVIGGDSGQKCYFMDTEGYIFDEAPYFSGNVYFKFYGSLNTAEPMGIHFLGNKFINIIKFKETIESMKLSPTAFWLENNGDANFSLSKDPTIGGKIIFKIDSDFEKIAENLQAAVSGEPLKSKLKNNLSSLLYIDLRFSNKVYDKFQ